MCCQVGIQQRNRQGEDRDLTKTWNTRGEIVHSSLGLPKQQWVHNPLSQERGGMLLFFPLPMSMDGLQGVVQDTQWRLEPHTPISTHVHLAGVFSNRSSVIENQSNSRSFPGRPAQPPHTWSTDHRVLLQSFSSSVIRTEQRFS